ncbi:DsbA family protein [Fructilactobacillus vespulae]|uniref:DsbA family protein n=1 Tax=Fructilactobacillus vespulae TaxID=1249630 RepID=UPI0039B45C70
MIEVYLFIDPSCSNCLTAEQDVTKVTENLPGKVCLRFIPFITLETLNRKNQNNIDPYQIIVDYKAALYQGCKKGRSFLQDLQEAVLKQNVPYSEKLAYQIALENKLDLEMFKEDRISKLIKANINSDQELVREMGITNHENLVIFDCRSVDNGILIDKFDLSQLESLFQKIINHTPKQKLKAFPHLKVL